MKDNSQPVEIEQDSTKPTERPWVVQQLNHVDNELWLQIGWIEGGRAIGPICELIGGAVKPSPSFKAVAEFKYLIASDEEVRANAELIVNAVNAHASLITERDQLREAFKSALDRIEASFKSAAEERYQELKEWERGAYESKDKGDMYGWNFHMGMAAGANWCDIYYQRVNREVRALQEELILSPVSQPDTKQGSAEELK